MRQPPSKAKSAFDFAAELPQRPLTAALPSAVTVTAAATRERVAAVFGFKGKQHLHGGLDGRVRLNLVFVVRPRLHFVTRDAAAIFKPLVPTIGPSRLGSLHLRKGKAERREVRTQGQAVRKKAVRLAALPTDFLDRNREAQARRKQRLDPPVFDTEKRD